MSTAIPPDLQAQVARVLIAGDLLANIAYNLKQRPNTPLSSQACSSMAESQAAWDKAAAALRDSLKAPARPAAHATQAAEASQSDSEGGEL